MTIDSHQFHPSILREYDIRGVYQHTLHDQDAWAIGLCFSYFLPSKKDKTVVVGMDGRLSSPSLESFLVRGLQEAGVNVVRIGIGPTPLLYYAMHSLEADGGIMITGSHNPPSYNGFKMILRNRPIFGDEISSFQTLTKIIHQSSSMGSVKAVDVKGEYIGRLLKDSEFGRPLKVVWDAGNGATGEILEELVKRLPGEHVVLHSKIDGTFPHHHPDPSDEHTLEDIKRTLNEQNADIGIAFDGDGDRLGVIDQKGNLITGDHLLILFSRDVLVHHPGATIISDVKASEAFFDDVKVHGGKPLMWKTGHSLIKQKMKETRALLAGEISGHFFFADHYYGFDDALYTSIRLLNIVSSQNKPVSSIVEPLPRYFSTPEIRIQCDDDKKFEVVKEIKERLLTENTLDIFDLDGVRVKSSRGWYLVRASNTQDMLVCRAEAMKEKDLEDLIDILKQHLKLSGVEFLDNNF